MEFMNSMFGDNTAPMQQVALPSDDTAMQLELKRRLKLAEALQQQTLPEGQMVSGRYVAPSFTQYLANAVNKYQGAKQEREALGQFGEYQKGKQAKYANLLNELGQGKEVTEPMDYNEAGNMPGMEQTTRQPFTKQEYMAKVGGVMPELLPEFLKADIASQFKEDVPMDVGPGHTIYKGGKAIFTAPNKEESRYAKINPLEATPESLAEYERTGNPTVLRKIPTVQTPRNVQFEKLREGTKEVTYQINPDGTRTKIAEGPAFAPEKPQPDPYHFNDKPMSPLTNSKGWVLHTDAKGNKAYVSPDGKSFEEAR
jgi:hypothetical protein